MIDLFQAMVSEERYKDFYRYAESRNIRHIVLAEFSRPHMAYNPILARLGRLMLNWGWRLQIRWGGVVELPAQFSQTRHSI